MESAGLKVDPGLQFDTDSQETSGASATVALLESGKPFDAIFAASDLIAIGAIKRLRKAGLIIPADVSVVGFDNIPAASYFNPSLTTVHQDTIAAGEQLVSQLIGMIKGEQRESQLLHPKLVIRGSCGGKPGSTD